MRFKTKGLAVPEAFLDQVEHLRGQCGPLAKAIKEQERAVQSYVESVKGPAGQKLYQPLVRDAIDALVELTQALAELYPYSVCPGCKLIPELQNICAACGGRGWVSEETYVNIEPRHLLEEGPEAGVYYQGEWRLVSSFGPQPEKQTSIQWSKPCKQ